MSKWIAARSDPASRLTFFQIFFLLLYILSSLEYTKKNKQGLLRYLGVSKNRGGPPKSSILIEFSIIINHPFWGTPIFGNTHLHKRYTNLYIRTLPQQYFLQHLQPFIKLKLEFNHRKRTGYVNRTHTTFPARNSIFIFRSLRFLEQKHAGHMTRHAKLGVSKLEEKGIQKLRFFRFHSDSQIPEFDLCSIWVLNPKPTTLQFTCSCCYH